MYSIFPIRAFNDNYIWAISNQETGAVVVVDPGDAAPVLDYLKQRRYSLVSILITHHHMDHTGGIQALLDVYDVPVYGGHQCKTASINNPLKENDQVNIMGLCFSVIEVPGHTLDHIAYYVEDGLNSPALFCGDTLFSGGCGRLFEGTPLQMNHSLKKLAALPDSTEVYCTHEYTLANLAFAKSVMPNNAELKCYSEKCEALRAHGQPTLPSSVIQEKLINPFLRNHDPEVIKQAEEKTSRHPLNEDEVFTAIRKWKDNF